MLKQKMIMIVIITLLISGVPILLHLISTGMSAALVMIREIVIVIMVMIMVTIIIVILISVMMIGHDILCSHTVIVFTESNIVVIIIIIITVILLQL